MLSSTELIKSKVASGLYKRSSVYNFDISEIMEELRQDSFYDKFPDDQLIEYAIQIGLKETDETTEKIVAQLKENEKFKNFTETELYEYAYGIQQKKRINIQKITLRCYVDNNKPEDPVWGQYSYEEILEMEAIGVMVPEDFLEWAHGEQDANAVDFEIENDGSTDENTVENLENTTNNDTQASLQKKSQTFSSKADAQQDLIEQKSEQTNPMAQDISDEQERLLSAQKSSIEDTNKKIQEWENLDAKAKDGTLSENEKRRYKELGISLDNNNEDFSSELRNLSEDIDEFMSQMDDITVLIDINDKLNTELEDTSIRASDFEGDKHRGYLGDKKDLGKFGTVGMMGADAMGGDLPKNTAENSLELESETVDIESNWNSNVSAGETVNEKLSQAQDIVQNNQLDDVDTNISEEHIQTEPVEAEQETKPETQPEIADTSVEENTINATDTEVSDESTVIDEKVNTEAADESEAVEFAQEQDNVDEATVQDSEGISDVSDMTDGETNTESNSEDEDPMKTLTSEYLTGCSQRQTELDTAASEVKSLTPQVQSVKDSRFVDETTTSLTYKSRLKEYKKLASKAESGKELSESDIAKISELESYLDTENGEYVTSKQNKLDTLNSYLSAVDNLKQLVSTNTEYGNQAVAQGKAYAESEMNDTTSMKRNSGYILLNKEKRYDVLYGKSGESLGRDLIDSGESLVNSSSKNLKDTNNISSKLISGFANEYSEKLNADIADMKAEVGPLQGTIANAISEQQAKAEAEKLETSASEAETVQEEALETDASENSEVSEIDETTDETENIENTDAAEDSVKEELGKEKDIKTDDFKIIKTKISENKKNAGAVEDLNNKSQEVETEIQRTISSQSSLVQTTNAGSNAVSSDDTSKLQSMADDIETNSRGIDRMVKESSTNTPVFNEETKLLKNAYKASVAAVNSAADKNALKSSLITMSTNVADNSVDVLSENTRDDAVETANDIAEAGAEVLQAESVKDEPEEEELSVVDEDAAVEEAIEDEPEAQQETFVDSNELPANINENSTENDLEKVCMDKFASESEENTILLKDNAANLSMEKLARDAAKEALSENEAKNEAKTSASASASVGGRLQNSTSKSETSRNRRLISYEDKNRRAALADKVENSKKVTMKRGKKKSS